MEAYIAKYGYIGIFIGDPRFSRSERYVNDIKRYEEYIIPAILIGVIILINDIQTYY
jgi:hypothetical protein